MSPDQTQHSAVISDVDKPEDSTSGSSSLHSDSSSCASLQEPTDISSVSSMSSDEGSDISIAQVTSQPTSLLPTFKLVEDNLDKTLSPHDMRIDNQTQSLHYLHMYAVCDHIDLSRVADHIPSPDSSVDLSVLLPSAEDEKSLLHDFSVFVAHTLKKRVAFFKVFGEELEHHIVHEHNEAMSKKSEVVRSHPCIYISQ